MKTIEASIEVVATKPYGDQTMGTSGLRKKVAVVQQEHYVENFLEAIFRALPEFRPGDKLVVGGDGRYFNVETLHMIIAAAAAHGVTHVMLAQNGLASTPAISKMVRKHRAAAAILLTASHNPGGPTADFGIKVNMANGGPSLKEFTDSVYAISKTVTEFAAARLAEPIDIAALGATKVVARKDGAVVNEMLVEVVDSVPDYLELCKECFDFELIKAFLAKSGFRVVVDSLHAVTGIYTKRIFVDELGLPASSLRNNVPKDDFNGIHADPNLKYAHDLVEVMNTGACDFGCAFDGDGDRNMIVGNKFFVSPSDSLAVLTANFDKIMYFSKRGFKGAARSMPTSAALDHVIEAFRAEGQKVNFFEVPTGWKFFGNAMDANKVSICGEESFGTGSDLIREKDGIWAALAWLSVLAHFNADHEEGTPYIGVADVVREHWKTYGRNYYSRYDYENVTTEAGAAVMQHLEEKGKQLLAEKASFNGHELVVADDFQYHDQFDGSLTTKQGKRFIFADGTRIIFRLSGTGSVGATIRVYFDLYESDAAKLDQPAAEALKDLIALALQWGNVAALTGRDAPDVIT